MDGAVCLRRHLENLPLEEVVLDFWHLAEHVSDAIWCGDCVQQCPLIQRIAEANPKTIHLKFIDRDLHADLSDPLKLNAGGRVPVALLLAEDFEFCGLYGDRTLSRYRALAARQIGPSCPLAIAPPRQRRNWPPHCRSG